MEPGVSSDTGAFQELEKTIEEKNLPKILARRGMSLSLGEGVYLNILFPDRDNEDWETNTASIVTKLTYGDTSFLLTGDSPIAIEKYLSMIDGKNLKKRCFESRTSRLSDIHLGIFRQSRVSGIRCHLRRQRQQIWTPAQRSAGHS